MSAVIDTPPAAAAPDKPRRSERLANQGVRLGRSATAERLRSALLVVLPPLLGLGFLLLVWQAISLNNTAFPSPAVTWAEALPVRRSLL